MSRSAGLPTLPLGAGANAVGAALIVGAAVGADREGQLADQLGWLSLAITGLLIALSADAMAILAGRRRLALRRRELGQGVSRIAAAAERLPAGAASHVLVVSGGKRYHRAGCALVVGKDVAAALVVDVRSTHAACGMCQP